MSSKPFKQSLRKDTLYKNADHTWTVAAWIWSAVIIVFLVSFAAGLVTTEPTDQTIFNRVLRWLSNQQSGSFWLLPVEIYRKTALTVLIIFIAITLLTVILRQLLNPPASKNVLDELLEEETKVTRERETVQKANQRRRLLALSAFNKGIEPNIKP
jgi:hypothetical protein